MSQIEDDERAAQQYAALVAASARHDQLATNAPQLADNSTSPISTENPPEVVNDPEKCFNPKVWSEQPQVSDALSPRDRKHIYSRKSMWALFVLAVFVIGGAIGGGIGGGIAQQNRKERVRESAAAAISSASPTPALTTPTTSLRSTTTTIPSPTSTTVRHMGFSMQIWEQPNFQGRSQMFYDPGHFQTAFLARSYVYRPGMYTNEMEKCSIAFCFGSNELGWRGASESKQPGHPLNSTWGVDNINIACGANFASPGCPGPMQPGVTFTTAPLFETSIQLTTQPAPTGSSGRLVSSMSEVSLATISLGNALITVGGSSSSVAERSASTTSVRSSLTLFGAPSAPTTNGPSITTFTSPTSTSTAAALSS